MRRGTRSSIEWHSNKESTPKGRGLHLHPKRGLPIGNIGFLISNAKAQMSNECQRPKSRNVIGLTLKNRNLSCSHETDPSCSHETDPSCSRETEPSCSHETDPSCSHETEPSCSHETEWPKGFERGVPKLNRLWLSLQTDWKQPRPLVGIFHGII